MGRWGSGSDWSSALALARLIWFAGYVRPLSARFARVSLALIVLPDSVASSLDLPGAIAGDTTRRAVMFGALCGCVAACGRGTPPAPAPAEPGKEIVGRVTGMMSVMDGLGREYRLAGLAPAPDWPDGVCASLRDRFSTEMAAVLDGRALVVDWDDGDRPDRWGRRGAVVVPLGDGPGGDGPGSDGGGRVPSAGSVQEHLLAAGLARFHPEPATRQWSVRLLRAEARARARGLGLWGDDRFCVLSPLALSWLRRDGVAGMAGFFVVVQGRVQTAEPGRSGIDLGFAERGWRGLALKVGAGARDRFPDVDMVALRGAWVRARGDVALRAGRPVIVLNEAAQLVRLM